MQTALAIYGAVVATGALGWHAWTWWRARRRIAVDIALAAAAYPQGNVWCVVVTAVNRSDHAVNVTGAGLVMQDGSSRLWVAFQPLSLSELPGSVGPHNSGGIFIESAVVEEAFDLHEPIVAWVRTATESEPVRSKPATLLAPGTVLPS